jgi:type IV secretory pathway VirB6-like protein
MLSVFFAGETWAKVSSVALYGGGGGFIIFASFIVAICLFVMTLLWVVVVYLIGVIPMTLMILISPIFFVLMLFKSTNRLFQNWVKEFLSHSLQAILAMAALALFALLVIEYVGNVLHAGRLISLIIYA